MLLEKNLRSVQHLGIPVVDYEKAKNWYKQILEFNIANEYTLPADGDEIKVAFMEKGDITIELYRLVSDGLGEIHTRSHGHIDHFTIDVLDIDQALAEVKSKGAKLDSSTPEGPLELNTFWSKGVRYVFLQGPQGEKIELNQRLDLSPVRRINNLNGWAHLGIPTTNIIASNDFYHQFGFKEIMRAAIPTEEEAIQVLMLEKDGFILEIYQMVGLDLEEVRARCDGHIDHIALDVNNVEEAFRELTNAGFNPLEETPVFLPFHEKGVKYFNVRGPDGEKIEFNEKIL